MLRTLFFAGLARGNLGDFGGALRALERKRRLLEEYEVHFYRARTDTLLSWIWREVGDRGRAGDLAEQAVAEAREVQAGSLQVEQELHAKRVPASAPAPVPSQVEPERLTPPREPPPAGDAG